MEFNSPRLVKHDTGYPNPRWALINYEALMTHYTIENCPSSQFKKKDITRHCPMLWNRGSIEISTYITPVDQRLQWMQLIIRAPMIKGAFASQYIHISSGTYTSRCRKCHRDESDYSWVSSSRARHIRSLSGLEVSRLLQETPVSMSRCV